MYLNKVYLLGNLTKDPEMKALPSGSKVTNFSIATNRYYKDANGAKQEAVEFHNIVVFGAQAENSAQYLKKGQSVLIEGRIQTRSWDDPATSSKKYRTEILADSVQFGAKTGTAGAPTTLDNDNSGSSASKKKDDLDTIDYGEVIDPDDIPF
jgi:single-strand DNA-binding protein